MKSVKSKPK